ncbi:MAG: hypothetical protein ACK5MH_09640 [Bacteroidales bacterium]
MKSFAEIDIENNGNYIKLLSSIAKLSGLFSDSDIPYINYRVVENIFCLCFKANNLSRSDTAFDAGIKEMGVGLKTFVCNNDFSTEKIAEFNSLASELNKYKGKDLAIKLAEARNSRIDLARRTYNINQSLYHIVARKTNKLILFETDYNTIDISRISNIKERKAGLQFEDPCNIYSFNYSKSTLFRKFNIPNSGYEVPVEIIDNPYNLILNLFKDELLPLKKLVKKEIINYVVLPLYSTNKNGKYVAEKSGLNQWRAGGRDRDYGEVYLRIPAEIHNKYPGFFPDRSVNFNLTIPTGEVFNASICQSNNKALMTNPNKALANWLLRTVLNLNEGEPATIDKLNKLGVDSVIVYKDGELNYRIDILKTDSYEEFINNK